MPSQCLLWHVACRLGDYLDASLNGVAKQPIRSELVKCLAVRRLDDPLDRRLDVEHEDKGITLHQYTLIASCWMLSLSKGWRLSRVVTSIGSWSSSSR